MCQVGHDMHLGHREIKHHITKGKEQRQMHLTMIYLHIFINSFLFLHFALEVARCPYRILQINYVDVDVDVNRKYSSNS